MLGEVNGKPAVIVTRAARRAAHRAPTPDDCRAGRARCSPTIHVAAVDVRRFARQLARRALARELRAQGSQPKLSAAENDPHRGARTATRRLHDDTVLPRASSTATYFHDNVLWDDDGTAGVIDFYFACDDALLYDVAIAVNDWCVNPDATLDRERARGLPRAATRCAGRWRTRERAAVAGDAAARGAAHLARAPRLHATSRATPQMTIAEGPRLLAPPARAPHRPHALARAALMDAQHPGRRGACRPRLRLAGRGLRPLPPQADRVDRALRGLDRDHLRPASWCRCIGGVIANFLQPVFFASFAIAALRQAAGEPIGWATSSSASGATLRSLVHLGALLLIVEIAIFALMAAARAADGGRRRRAVHRGRIRASSYAARNGSWRWASCSRWW